MGQYNFENIIAGGKRTKRLAANTEYDATTNSNYYVVGVFIPDETTSITTITDQDDIDISSEMGMDVTLTINPPVEHFDKAIRRFEADKAVVLLLRNDIKG